MKTPRDILLEHHRRAQPALDQTRRHALATLHRAGPETTPGLGRPFLAGVTDFGVRAWRELILPCRRFWVGLAAVWLVLLGFQGVTRGPAPSPRGGASATIVVQVPMTIAERRQALLELTWADPTQAARSAPTPKLGPRSEQSDNRWRSRA